MVWNDRDNPLAYLITFRTHGTWLHGDKRGSVDRAHNQFGTERIPPDPKWVAYNSTLLKSNPVILTAKQRSVVTHTIRKVCAYRKWFLKAINVRTNHVHLVAAIGQASPEKAMRDFKAYSTRKLRELALCDIRSSPWTSGGSTRYLWTERAVGLACEYVITGQGDALPNFD